MRRRRLRLRLRRLPDGRTWLTLSGPLPRSRVEGPQFAPLLIGMLSRWQEDRIYVVLSADAEDQWLFDWKRRLSLVPFCQMRLRVRLPKVADHSQLPLFGEPGNADHETP